MTPSAPTDSAYAERIIHAGCALALPELATGAWPDAVYRLRDRRGVGAIALPTAALSEEQRDTLLRFRFAQYLAAGFIDSDLARRDRLEREPPAPEERATVNFLAFSSRDGRLLANLSLRAPGPAPWGTTLRTRERALLPLEEHFGWGALNRLHLLPELPLGRIRELGRFVKNHRLGEQAELGVRGVAEVCLAAFHSLTGPLCMEVEAFVGEFEDAVARRHLEFLRTPFTMVRGGLPAFGSDHILGPALNGHARYPFAVLVSDMTGMAPRLAAIEAALAEPGLGALLALASNDSPRPPASSLARTGRPGLADIALPQRDLSLSARRLARKRGARLRRFAAFGALSDTECTALYGLLDELRARPGERIVSRGQPSRTLYLIERGEVLVGAAGGPLRLGPGDCFGEIGLLTGHPWSADVVARSELEALGLSAAVYDRYLRELPEVARELAGLGLERAAADLRPAA